MIYLDYAAATPVCAEAMKAMEPYFAQEFFNPSAPYLPAKRVREAYERAKDELAHTIGAKGADLVMTAGATEAINLALTAAGADRTAEVLVLATEHPAVRVAAAQWQCQEIGVDRTGLIKLGDLKAKLTDETRLISVPLADGELGVVQPVAEVAQLVKEERLRRWQRGIKTPLYLHSDASQALNLLDVNVARLGVDLLTINSPKVYGPKGVGALYVAHGVRLEPLVRGGGQELGLRAGTENVSGVVGFAAAAVRAKQHLNGSRKKYAKLAQAMREGLGPAEPVFGGNKKHQLVNFVPVSFPGVDAERLIYLLEDQGVYVATGAACAASKGEKSHVLTAIGLSEAEIAGSLRITLGELNDEAQVREAAQRIVQAVKTERERSHGA